MAEHTNVHTVAALTFARLQRRASFRAAYPWIKHAFVCVESDLIEEVRERIMNGLPEGVLGTVAVYFPEQQQFIFTTTSSSLTGAESVPTPSGYETILHSDDLPHDQMTVGQVLSAVKLLAQNWKTMPVDQRPSHVGVESTAEIERDLALT
jgi:hypothetical protein